MNIFDKWHISCLLQIRKYRKSVQLFKLPLTAANQNELALIIQVKHTCMPLCGIVESLTQIHVRLVTGGYRSFLSRPTHFGNYSSNLTEGYLESAWTNVIMVDCNIAES